MKQIAVISGKGGTGKTVIAASLAVLAQDKVLVDCDVDAANLYLLLNPQIQETCVFQGSKVPVINTEQCMLCGICESVCRFNAISDLTIDPIACERCGVCAHMCPEDAIDMKDEVDGEWFLSKTRYGVFVHARLHAGRPNSGKLVSVIKQRALAIAKEQGLEWIIVDGPPGIGCPVIASLSGVDLALVVVEPTLCGLHDMQRIVEVVRHFQIRPAVCINKCTLNVEMASEIDTYCDQNAIPVLGHIPFSRTVVDAVAHCVPVVEFVDNGISEKITHLWEQLVCFVSN